MKLAALLDHLAAAPSIPAAVADADGGTVHELFREHARATPDAVAVRSAEGDLTYTELDRWSDRLACHLVAHHGVRREELVPLVMARSPRLVVAMLAVLKAGAAYVPILPSDPIERVHFLLADTGCRTVVTEPEFAAAVMAAPGSPVTVLFAEGVDFPPADAAGLPSFEEDGASLAYVMYTSGTTGRPKGALIEHRGIERLVIDPGYVRIAPEDCILQAGSQAFDASTFEIWGALLNGASVCIAPKEVFLQPAALRELIRREKITVAFLTTVLFNQFADAPGEIFRGLRVLLTGGERVSARHVSAVRRTYPEMDLLHVYGPTENTTFTTAFRVDGEPDLDVPIGAPIGRTTAAVLGADLRRQPTGVAGELCTGGDGLARGYLNDPALTAASFIPDPAGRGARLYRTGDLARWSTDFGARPVLEFCGRIDDQVKIRGFRIEPGEIECRLREIAGVRDAAVVARAGADGNKSLTAYLTADAGLDAAAVRAFCKGSLPDYMVPGDFVFLENFPLNANGKVDQAALPLPEREVVPPSPATTAASTLEQLRAIWAEILNRADIGEDEDFFDAGGHSLAAVQMVSFVEERMGAELPINVIFDAPTLRELTAYLLDSARFGVAALDDGMVLMDGDPGQGALFAFPPGTADCLGYCELAAALRPAGFYGFTFLESEDRVKRYADLILKSHATAPYRLFGYSSGGNLAYHVAREIEARGGVVASVILLDSARHLADLRITPAQMTKVADDFLNDDRARAYLTSAVLRDKAHRNIVRNLQYISGCLDAHTISADIHLVACENGEETHHDDSGQPVVSKLAWETATTGRFHWHPGAGGHDHMLHAPHFADNAAIIRTLLAGGLPESKNTLPSSGSPARPEHAASASEGTDPLAVFAQLESGVRSYCRSFPTVFTKAQGARLHDRNGRTYIDFFCGAGALNYGHNPPSLKRALLDYIEADGVSHSLDMATGAKEHFLSSFASTILRPRGLDYRVQFVGPTGANGVEASLKLARKVKGRGNVVAFTNAYHGLSSGALAVTANTHYRHEAYVQRTNVAFMPYDGYMGEGIDTLDYFERCLDDTGSGLDAPAAVIVETIQAEGGINVARVEWLRRLEALCRQHDMLFIVDDIQVGCGRAGNFFSFERAGVSPDLVILSKSISGYGLPMSIVLLKPEADLWNVGEHTGTFRGNNLAFVTAAAALELWSGGGMERGVAERSQILSDTLQGLAREFPPLQAKVRGLGLIFGFEIADLEIAQRVTRECFTRGLILEMCGPGRNVLKFLPPLVIDPADLRAGLEIVREAIASVVESTEEN